MNERPTDRSVYASSVAATQLCDSASIFGRGLRLGRFCALYRRREGQRCAKANMMLWSRRFGGTSILTESISIRQRPLNYCHISTRCACSNSLTCRLDAGGGLQKDISQQIIASRQCAKHECPCRRTAVWSASCSVH